MKQLFTYLTLLFLLLIGNANSHAAGFSYVYIQGDKQTPFYVKFEDEMLPRYGKNYSIISQLAPGPIHIQILFQQNVFPPQNFTIQVPENGFRGFLLTQKGDAFSLYDIQQQVYLQAGNAADEDKMPANNPNNIYIPTTKGPEVDNTIKEPETVLAETPAVETINNIPPAPEPEINTPPVTETQTQPVVANNAVRGPEFIDIELNNGQNNENTIPTGDKYKGEVAIANSDCPKAIDNDLLEAIQKKATDKPDKTRLKYLLDKTEGNCYTTNQIRVLARTLKNDPERYAYLKTAYSRVTDQSKFPQLESLLTTEEWKSYFRLILP